MCFSQLHSSEPGNLNLLRVVETVGAVSPLTPHYSNERTKPMRLKALDHSAIFLSAEALIDVGDERNEFGIKVRKC